MSSSAASSTTIGTETLYEIIGAIVEGPTLDRVLRAVVDLLVRATACHACFIYLREGDELTIRAASPVFEHAVGSVRLGMDEGLTGWVARNRTPAFIRDEAMNDPRMKYVPELEEERFQSMIAVPLLDRRGDVIGVVVLHTQAPREFGQDVLDLLVHVASLVVGAIDNARLYDQTQRQVTALSALNSLSQQLASMTSRDDLFGAGCEGLAKLLRADRCELSLFDANGAAVEVASTRPHRQGDESQARGAARGRLTARLLESGRAFGLVRVTRPEVYSAEEARLLETATNQLALALRTAALIERLTAENRTREVFEALEGDRTDAAVAHARIVGWTGNRSYTAIVGIPCDQQDASWEDGLGAEVEQRLRLVTGNALIDIRRDQVRALAHLPHAVSADGERLAALRDRLSSAARELGVGFGLASARTSLTDGRAALREAADAARVSIALDPHGTAYAYEDLGPYRFLVGLIDAAPPDHEHAAMLAILAEHDTRRGSELLATLEAYLSARGGVRTTSESLFIHPNTLRQRLERIERLTGRRLDGEDLLSLELSLKLRRLRTTDPAG